MQVACFGKNTAIYHIGSTLTNSGTYEKSIQFNPNPPELVFGHNVPKMIFNSLFTAPLKGVIC